MRLTLFFLLTLGLLVACIMQVQRSSAGNQPSTAPASTAASTQRIDPMKVKTATFAAGCFWGVETSLRRVPGVLSTQVGYIGGTTKDPTYQDVCTDLTGHAEAVRVTYDTTQVSYAELLDAFWTCHDPTTLNSQGPDFGTQYRSAIFFYDAEQEKIAKASLAEVEASAVFKRKIVTQIVPAPTFYPAEEYHQQYFEKHGRAESCHVGVAKVHTKLAAVAAEARKVATRPAQ